jgi:threonine dehydrogenase-like Zn-dependent dehydrogenase
MLGVTFPGDREVAILNFPDPTPDNGEVVIEIKASGLCGSDLHAYRAPKDLKAFKEAARGRPYESMRDHGPLIVGHEPCGVIVAVGPGVTARQARVGQRVMVHHYSGCGTCDQCRTGWPQICEGTSPQIYGWTGHGAHAKYMKVAAHTVVTLPDELSFAAGAALSCGSGTSYSALQRMQPNGTHTVVIFGQGPVGLSGTQFAVAMGCTVIAAEINPDRRKLAKQFGADVVLDPSTVNVRDAVRELTHGRGADYSLETSGAPSAAVDAVRCLRLWGTATFVGIGAPVSLNLATDVIFRQVTLLGSYTFSTNILEECARFAADRKVEVDAIFSDRWKLEDAEKAYQLLDAQTAGKGVFLL